MTIENTINKEFSKARRRGWDKIYVFVDFHEVIIVPDYQSNIPKVEYYPFAKELLQYLTNRDDICLVTWTCSHPHQIDSYLNKMSKDGIVFDFVNCNPEVTTDSKYGFYEKKPYYNILLDDKAGVEPDELEHILKVFSNQPLLRTTSQIETFKINMYCGSIYTIAHAVYDERKRPKPPYNTLRVNEIKVSDSRLKIEKIVFVGKTFYPHECFVICSGMHFTIHGKWSGPIDHSVQIELVGELIVGPSRYSL